MMVDDSAQRMTARTPQVEEGVYEADFTNEPPEELTPTTEYDKRFASEAEARRWLELMAEVRAIDVAEIIWIAG